MIETEYLISMVASFTKPLDIYKAFLSLAKSLNTMVSTPNKKHKNWIKPKKQAAERKLYW